MTAIDSLTRWSMAIAMCLILVSHTALAGEPAAISSAEGASFVSDKLRGCALWTTTPQYDVDARERITETYFALAHFKTATIRAGIVSYIDSYIVAGRPQPLYIEATQKIYAFLRVVFKVPPRVDASKALPFYLMGNPVYPDGADALWPYSTDSSGKLKLTGVDSGLHTGVPYDPVSEFDKMTSRLDRRFPVND